jgi:hypothetical protein
MSPTANCVSTPALAADQVLVTALPAPLYVFGAIEMSHMVAELAERQAGPARWWCVTKAGELGSGRGDLDVNLEQKEIDTRDAAVETLV